MYFILKKKKKNLHFLSYEDIIISPCIQTWETHDTYIESKIYEKHVIYVEFTMYIPLRFKRIELSNELLVGDAIIPELDKVL